jgi:hypothetical protein
MKRQIIQGQNPNWKLSQGNEEYCIPVRHRTIFITAKQYIWNNNWHSFTSVQNYLTCHKECLCYETHHLWLSDLLWTWDRKYGEYPLFPVHQFYLWKKENTCILQMNASPKNKHIYFSVFTQPPAACTLFVQYSPV